MNPEELQRIRDEMDDDFLSWYYGENPTESLEACDQWKVERDYDLDSETKTD